MLTFANARETLTCLEVTLVLKSWRTALGVTLVGWLVGGALPGIGSFAHDLPDSQLVKSKLFGNCLVTFSILVSVIKCFWKSSEISC